MRGTDERPLGEKSVRLCFPRLLTRLIPLRFLASRARWHGSCIDTERSVSSTKRRRSAMTQAVAKDRPDRLPRPHRQDGPRRTDRQRQGRPQGHQDAEVQDGRRGPVPPSQFHPQPAGLRGRRAAGPARRRHRAESVGSLARGARLVPRGRHPRQRGGARHHRLQARDRAGRRSQHHRRVGHRRPVGQAGRLHRRAREGDRSRPTVRARSSKR